MSDISTNPASQQRVTFHLQERHLKDPIRLVRENATRYQCTVSEIHVQNHHLFQRHSVILSSQECEALPEKLKEEGWYDFFRANSLFIVENEFPNALPADEKKGKKRNIPEAISLLTTLSEKLNFPPAQNSLALCYFWGVGVKKDSGQMVRWLQAAAGQNFAIAIRNLGWCYREGQGLQKNYQLASDLFQRALKLGLMMAASDIADLYETATPPNIPEALRYYEYALKHGVEKARSKVEELRKIPPVTVQKAVAPTQTQGQSAINFQDLFNLLPRMQSLQVQVQQLTQQLAQKDLQIAEMQKQQDVHNAEMKAMLTLVLQKLDSKESAAD